jgi:tRNA pseudouridine13 synthase
MNYDLNFPRASQIEPARGMIKQQAEDFYVEEMMSPELSGEGEHVWLWVEKIGQNTEYLAGQIASFANVKKMDVGFSGQKDRWAKTRQWFSVYLGAKPEPDWSQFDFESVVILSHTRHSKKLRRGEHYANYFKLVITQLENSDNLDTLLSDVKKNGYPNYYGPQRFGNHGANLERGERYFEGEIKASRSQRSFYLSAARSYLFNLNLARHVESGEWLENSEGGPLYGDSQRQVVPLNQVEIDILEAHPSLKKGIHQNRLKLERRPYKVMPENMSWHIDGGQVRIEFTLPTGVFATSLLAEAFTISVGLGEG